MDYGSIGGALGGTVGSLAELFYRRRRDPNAPAQPEEVEVPSDQELTTPAQPETVAVPSDGDLQGGGMGRLARAVMGGAEGVSKQPPAQASGADPGEVASISNVTGPAPNQRSFYQGGIKEAAEVEHGAEQMAASAKLGKGVGKLVKMLASMGAGAAAGGVGAGGAQGGAGFAAGPSAGGTGSATAGMSGADVAALDAGGIEAVGPETGLSAGEAQTMQPQSMGGTGVGGQERVMDAWQQQQGNGLRDMLQEKGEQQLEEQLGQQQGEIVEGMTDYDARQEAFRRMLAGRGPVMAKDIFGTY